MNKKMTKQDYQNYIISEATKLYKIEVLKEQKNSIDKELKMLSESINDDELEIDTAKVKMTFENIMHVISDIIRQNKLNYDEHEEVMRLLREAIKWQAPDKPSFGGGENFGSMYEQWNPDDNYMGDYFIATAPMDGPGEIRAHVIGDDEIQEYEEAGWHIGGPYDKQTAELKYDKVTNSNKLLNYLDTISDEDAERQEKNYFFGDGSGKPSHMSAVDRYHDTNKDIDNKISKRNLRNPKEW